MIDSDYSHVPLEALFPQIETLDAAPEVVSETTSPVSEEHFSPLRMHRLQQNMSQCQLSVLSHVSNKIISSIERGTVIPTQQVLQKLANALHVPVAEIASTGELRELEYTTKYPVKTVTLWLKNSQEKKIITLSDLALKAHVCTKTLTNILHGRTNTGKTTAYKIGRVLEPLLKE